MVVYRWFKFEVDGLFSSLVICWFFVESYVDMFEWWSVWVIVSVNVVGVCICEVRISIFIIGL